MNAGKYIFSQLVSFLPKRVFDGIVKRHEGDKWVKHFTCWNQLLVMMFGQLVGCDSLREVAAIIDAIKSKSYHLGFGSGDIKLSNMSYANANRDYKIFEEFAYYMIDLAQSKIITRPFELNGKFYAFDSTTIDLCMSLFEWAYFRKTKSGIKVHTLFDVVTQIPTYIHITEAKLHDVKAMEHLKYEIVSGDDLLDGDDNVLLDQTIRLKGPLTKKKYPSELRRKVYYAPELKRRSHSLPTTFRSRLRILRCSTSRDVRLNCSSGG